MIPSCNDIRALPDSALLGLLVGDIAARTLTGRRLVDLFALHPRAPSVRERDADERALRILGAAKELVTRALAEALEAGERLDTPAKGNCSGWTTAHTPLAGFEKWLAVRCGMLELYPTMLRN